MKKSNRKSKRVLRKKSRRVRKQRAGGLFNFFTKKNTTVKKNNTQYYNNPLLKAKANSLIVPNNNGNMNEVRSPISSMNSIRTNSGNPSPIPMSRPITPVMSRSVSPTPFKATVIEGNTSQGAKSVNVFNNKSKLTLNVKPANQEQTANVKQKPSLQTFPPSRRLVESKRNITNQVKTRKSRR